MPTDRYTKVVLTVIAFALMAIAAASWIPGKEGLDAIRPQAAEAQDCPAVVKLAIPKASKFAAVYAGGWIFEDNDGLWILKDDPVRATDTRCRWINFRRP